MKLWIYGIGGALGCAWLVWLAYIWRILTKQDAVVEAVIEADPELEEADRRRQALGAVTRLDAYRQIQGARKRG